MNGRLLSPFYCSSPHKPLETDGRKSLVVMKKLLAAVEEERCTV